MDGVRVRDVFEKLPSLHLFWHGVLPDTLKSFQKDFKIFNIIWYVFYAHYQYNSIDLRKRRDRKQQQ